MALSDLVNCIRIADGKLKAGANNLAHRVNELVGLGNYQLSSLFFGAATAFYIYTFGSNVYHIVTTTDNYVDPRPLPYVALSVYHLVKNRSALKGEKKNRERGLARQLLWTSACNVLRNV